MTLVTRFQELRSRYSGQGQMTVGPIGQLPAVGTTCICRKHRQAPKSSAAGLVGRMMLKNNGNALQVDTIALSLGAFVRRVEHRMRESVGTHKQASNGVYLDGQPVQLALAARKRTPSVTLVLRGEG